ncbi:thioredoxin-domain-containing protein [Polychaeton citri CBS 116435]|uniref:Thioredoxin-domain-containing protein n=1 Tax=Polychaeton citri CBS 116435 TaxID=1314669 RepID=A0A9P4QFN0_9PEZI|nr:thioredoxin-domain-containing protein [Polychaeton citri CBS 116435]
MPGPGVTEVTSSSHFRTITTSNTFVIVDFYADWCGPCKVISPVFEQLAKEHAAQGRIAFVKVNVDSQRDVASQFGVSAMPTFLVLKNGSVTETIRGANPSALRSAVVNAAAQAGKGPTRSSVAFTGAGQKLGAENRAGAGPGANAGRNASGPLLPDLGAMFTSPAAFAQRGGVLSSVVRFIGLYLTTLFSIEPKPAAESSPFSVKQSGNRPNVSGSGRRL